MGAYFVSPVCWPYGMPQTPAPAAGVSAGAGAGATLFPPAATSLTVGGPAVEPPRAVTAFWIAAVVVPVMPVMVKRSE